MIDKQKFQLYCMCSWKHQIWAGSQTLGFLTSPGMERICNCTGPWRVSWHNWSCLAPNIQSVSELSFSSWILGRRQKKFTPTFPSPSRAGVFKLSITLQSVRELWRILMFRSQPDQINQNSGGEGRSQALVLFYKTSWWRQCAVKAENRDSNKT